MRPSGTEPRSRPRRIDDEDVVDVVGQVGRLAAMVDHLADRPAVRNLDQRALHQAPGRVFGIGQRAFDLGALGRRQLGQHLAALVLRQVLEDGRRVVGLELAGGGGDVLAVELVENVLEDVLVELGQRLGIEVALEDADQLVALGLGTCSRIEAWPVALRPASSARDVFAPDLRRARPRRAGPAPASLRRGRRARHPLIRAPRPGAGLRRRRAPSC